ncbi:hypothetical protein R1flu_010543 [Riccia fluitans]|uniref:Uncharacterized protein n=1 Tax=Riccia fluitans TaxID=41844 RepID=A0ABD1Z597_9MARC
MKGLSVAEVVSDFPFATLSINTQFLVGRGHLVFPAIAAAAQLGLTINVAQVGGTKQDPASVPFSPDGPQQEWLTTMVPDEDSQLHQLVFYKPGTGLLML